MTEDRPRDGLRDDPARPGPARTSARWGSIPTRLDGPIVGIASTWTGTMPCNLTQRELSDAAAAAVDAAGGVALPFNTIAVSDNQSQGTPGMRASLVSREVIADSIELMSHRARLRRARLHRRLRQDDARGADGARAHRQAGGAALQRPAARRAAAASAS